MKNTQNPAIAEGSRAFSGADLPQLLERPIAYHRIFAHVCGDPVAAIFLSQAFFWSPRTKDEEGWFYKTQAQWFDETGLTRRHQETARKKLVALGILKEVRRGIPAQLYFRLDLQRLAELIRAFLDGRSGDDNGDEKPQTRMAQSAKQGAPKRQPRMAQSANLERRQTPDQHGASAQAIKETKNTTKTTSKNTTTNAVVVDENLLVEMRAIGVSEAVARALLTEKPEACQQQTEWMQFRSEIKNPAAALVTAIREEWAAPETIQQRERERDAKAKREIADLAAIARKNAETAASRHQEELLTEENRQIDAYFSELGDEQKRAIEAETKRRLGVLGNVASIGAFQAMQRNILRPELGFGC